MEVARYKLCPGPEIEMADNVSKTVVDTRSQSSMGAVRKSSGRRVEEGRFAIQNGHRVITGLPTY